jgi:hypothetical protein
VSADNRGLDLHRRRDLAAILSDAFRLYGQHFGLFATLAFGVVVPVELLVGGIGLGGLWSNYAHDSAFRSQRGLIAPLVEFVEVPLITATHIHAVMRIADGETPSIAVTARQGIAVFAAVLGTLLLYLLGVIGGFILLILPGVYVAIRWYFASQVVVVEGLTYGAALKRSGALVQGNWWRVLGYGIVFQLVLLPLSLLVIPFEQVAESANRSVFALVGSMFVDGFSLSFVALTATLLYFDLRAREASLPAPAGASPAPWVRPGSTADLPLGDSPSAQPPSQPPPPPPQIFDPPRD